jgi:uncharacterized membrane protein
MENFILDIVLFISYFLGFLGVLMITLGSIKTIILFFKIKHNFFVVMIQTFNKYLILGLDFFVGKDLIDILLIDTKDDFYKEIILIFTVVFIRLILTLMAERELKDIK